VGDGDVVGVQQAVKKLASSKANAPRYFTGFISPPLEILLLSANT
jgi:hypothetical protein